MAIDGCPTIVNFVAKVDTVHKTRNGDEQRAGRRTQRQARGTVAWERQ